MASRTNRARKQWAEFIAGVNIPFVKLKCDHSGAVAVGIPASDRFNGTFFARVHPAAREAFEALAAVMAHHGYLFRETSGGTINCRKVANKSRNRSSLHAHGIAIDLNPGKNPFGTRRTDMPQQFASDVLAIRTNNGRPVWIWGMEFEDPMHFEVSASSRADVATGIDWSTVVGPHDGAVERPELDQVTDRVDVDDVLNLRKEPSTSSPIQAKLQKGAAVERLSNLERRIGEHVWVNVRSVVGRTITEGWVSSRFLTSIGAPRRDPEPNPDPDPSPAPRTGRASEPPMLRVIAPSGLNLRSMPSASASKITRLATGAVVVDLGEGEDAGGYRWVRVRAEAGDRDTEGWAASGSIDGGRVTERYLEAVGADRPADPPPKPTTLRVVAPSGLNLRPEPSTGAVRIALLETGAVVVDLGGAEDDGEYRWVRVRAEVGGRDAEGWVARGSLERGRVDEIFLEPTD